MGEKNFYKKSSTPFGLHFYKASPRMQEQKKKEKPIKKPFDMQYQRVSIFSN